MNRDFKGIWIPKEIWLQHNLSVQEICLWAEINSLYEPERRGCYASNEYLMEFLGVKERRLQEMLSSLKSKKLIIQVSFDGRQRVLKAILPPMDEEESSNPDGSAEQGCRKMHPTDAEKCTPRVQKSALSPYIERKDKKKEERGEQAPPPSSPSKKKKVKEEPELLPFGTYVQLKEGEYQSLSHQLGKEYVDYYIEAINNYVPNNKPYKDYAATIRSWYNRDKAKGSLPKSQNLHMAAGSSPEYLEKNKRICEAVEKQLKDQFNSFVYFQASPTKAILYNKNKYIDKSYDYSSYDPIQLKEILIRDLEICFPGSRNILLPPQKRPTQVTNLINNLANQYRPQEEIA